MVGVAVTALEQARQAAKHNLAATQASLITALEIADSAIQARKKAVRNAHELGMTRTEIAKALGITRQAVGHLDAL